MFVLDTNILSAMMAPNPAPEVAAYVSGQPAELLFTASICQAEILSGIAIMAVGRRRRGLEAAARAMFLEDFEGRVLSTWRRPSPMRLSSRPAGRPAGGDCRSHDRLCRLLPECKRSHPRHRRLRGVRRRNSQSVEWVARSVRSYEGREDAVAPK